MDQEATERHERAAQTGKYQHLSNVAALFCKNPRFHDWMRSFMAPRDWTEDLADKWLKHYLKIDSKSELDDPKNADAIAGFVRIKHGFVDWQSSQGDQPERLF